MPEKPKYYKISLRIDEATFNLLEKLREDTGFSHREILGYSSKTCVPCNQIEIPVFNKKRQTVYIPLGILFKSMFTKHSGYDKKIK